MRVDLAGGESLSLFERKEVNLVLESGPVPRGFTTAECDLRFYYLQVTNARWLLATSGCPHCQVKQVPVGLPLVSVVPVFARSPEAIPKPSSHWLFSNANVQQSAAVHHCIELRMLWLV